MRFAFEGRCSTEDQQDPESSRAWQLTRSKALVEPQGGVIVAEYFDSGQSRSIPWQRRPQAAALLEQLRNPRRAFDAVVIGEPQRAFYGNQFGLVFPLFVHYGVPLWVPEVGGPVDPDNEAHDLIMSVFGGMSKGERNRIKIRVRAAMASQAATEGRFLGGRPPYGYQLADAGPHPNPAKAAIGQRLHRLDRDPASAPVVQRIFTEYLAGRGLYAIADGLTRDGLPCPSAHDPARNRHRDGLAWSKSAVRAILLNPRYTGRQVWNRQRKDEVLLDVDDVAMGHITKMRWNDTDAWIWSTDAVHPALIDPDTHQRTQALLAARCERSLDRKPRATPRHYLLRGLLLCGACGRRMQGQLNNGKPHYRCRYPDEYALRLTHPRNVYLREDAIVTPLDAWLARAFEPATLPATVDTLYAAQDAGEAEAARIHATRRKISECDHKLATYRAALEAGAEPAVVAGWIAEVTASRAAADAQLRATKTRRRLSRQEIHALISTLGDLLGTLHDADPADKAELYQRLGLRLDYQPDSRSVLVEAQLGPGMGVMECPRGDLNPHALYGH